MTWGGVPLNTRTAAMMDEAQALYGATITATQGSPSTSVSASAMTHAGEGVIDVVGADLDAIVAAMRQVGFAAWHRTPAQGFIHHVHGVAVGEPGLDPSAALQVQAYFAGRNGLASNGADDGPREWVGVTWETYQGGTYEPPPPSSGDPVRMWNQYPGDRCGAYLQAPGGILAGTPTVAFNPGFTTFSRGEIAAPVTTMTLHAGDTVMLAALEDFDFGEPVADINAGYWLIRAVGGGTLTVADAYDLGYTYPSVTPTWVTRAKSGDDTAGFAYYPLDPVMLDGSHLYNDGQPLIRISCTAGTAVVDFVGVQVQTGSGYWLPDGETEWSPNQAPQTQVLAAPGFDGTYDVTPGATLLDDVWTVDGSPVYQFEPVGGALSFGRHVGGENSPVSAEDAVELRDANITVGLGGALGTASWTLSYDNGSGLYGAPEAWRSALDETPQLWSSPTKSELPGAPPGIPSNGGYLRSGTFEWFGDDTGFLGWVVGPADDASHHVQISGDAGTTKLFLNLFSEFVDPATFNHHTGTQLASWVKEDDEDLNVGGPYAGLQGEFGEFDITTSDTLLILTLDSTVREAIDLRHTYASSSSVEGYTGADVSLVNVPVAPRFRIPGYRYPQPSFVQAPTWVPTITDLEDPAVTYLRNRQRNDGLGGWSTPRTKGTSSRQLSLHNRGYE